MEEAAEQHRGTGIGNDRAPGPHRGPICGAHAMCPPGPDFDAYDGVPGADSHPGV